MICCFFEVIQRQVEDLGIPPAEGSCGNPLDFDMEAEDCDDTKGDVLLEAPNPLLTPALRVRLRMVSTDRLAHVRIVSGKQDTEMRRLSMTLAGRGIRDDGSPPYWGGPEAYPCSIDSSHMSTLTGWGAISN